MARRKNKKMDIDKKIFYNLAKEKREMNISKTR